MWKIVVGIAVIAFTTFCGYFLGEKYRCRKLFFMQFNQFNQRYLHEISYLRRPIENFLSEYVYEGEFNKFLLSFQESFKDDGRNWRDFLMRDDFSFLKMEERRLVEDYFLVLGRGDSIAQKAYFISFQERLGKLQKDSEKDSKKYGDLYIKIGFLCGLLFLLIII